MKIIFRPRNPSIEAPEVKRCCTGQSEEQKRDSGREDGSVLVSGQQWVSSIISYSRPVSPHSAQHGRGPSPPVSLLSGSMTRLARPVSWWKERKREGRGSGREEAGAVNNASCFFQANVQEQRAVCILDGLHKASISARAQTLLTLFTCYITC